MKRNICHTFLLATAAWLLASCGEDRTYEFLAKTEVDNWIEDQMQEVYLYYQDMPQLEQESYFRPPEEFFPMLLSSQDKFSYLETLPEVKKRNAIQPVTYGFDFEMGGDPTGTSSRQVARVLQVLPQSPAAQAGLQRGDFIVQADGRNLSNDNADLLRSGGGVALTVLPLLTDEETGLQQWGTDTLKCTLQPAIAMENNPFYLSRVYEQGGMKVGYLVYNEFKKGVGDEDNTYMDQMLQVFQSFKQQGVEEFILDLRYNQGGYVVSAQLLASLLAPADRLGQEFAHFVFSDKQQALNYSLPLLQEYAACNLGLDRLFIISGTYTASASEMMVNCLRPYMTVNLLGTRTVGKNVAMTQIDSPYGFTMYPVTSTVYNANGESDYASGFTPEYVITENNYYPWREMGDPDELLLRNALQWVAGQTPADAENVSAPEEPEGTEEPDTTVRVRTWTERGYSSIRRKGFPAAILPSRHAAQTLYK